MCKIKSSKIVEPILNKTPKKFKSNGYGKYEYPIYGKVPWGEYFSKIVRVKDTTTKAGEPAIEVFYDIRDFGVCYKIANRWINDNETDGFYYIKQKYKIDSKAYEKFVDLMAQILKKGDSEFEYEEIIGITEHIKLDYNSKNYGEFIERTPFDFWDYRDPRISRNYDEVEEIKENNELTDE